GRTATEALLPALLGGAVGFGVALGLTDTFAPRGSIDGSTVWSALAHAGVAVGAALGLLVLTAGFVFRRLFDTGMRSPGWLRWAPWEVPLLAVALYLLLQIRSGGGLTDSGSSATSHPTLAVFIVPVLLVAGAAGLGMRLVRLL